MSYYFNGTWIPYALAFVIGMTADRFLTAPGGALVEYVGLILIVGVPLALKKFNDANNY